MKKPSTDGLALDASEKELAIKEGINALKASLILKQEYLAKGITPINLPKEIFLKEDIEQTEYLLAILDYYLSENQK